MKRSYRCFSSAVKPRTCQCALLLRSHSYRASFLSSSVHGAPAIPAMYLRLSHTSTADAVGYLLLTAISMSVPNHDCTSARNLRLSASSSATGLLMMRTRHSGYFSSVVLAATADAAPHENHTAMTSPGCGHRELGLVVMCGTVADVSADVNGNHHSGGARPNSITCVSGSGSSASGNSQYREQSLQFLQPPALGYQATSLG